MWWIASASDRRRLPSTFFLELSDLQLRHCAGFTLFANLCCGSSNCGMVYPTQLPLTEYLISANSRVCICNHTRHCDNSSSSIPCSVQCCFLTLNERDNDSNKPAGLKNSNFEKFNKKIRSHDRNYAKYIFCKYIVYEWHGNGPRQPVCSTTRSHHLVILVLFSRHCTFCPFESKPGTGIVTYESACCDVTRRRETGLVE